MKSLTKREKVLIGILIFCILGYLVYTFILPKAGNSNDDVIATYNDTLSKYEEMRSNIITKNENEETIKKLNFQVNELSSGFLNEIKQEQVIVFIDKYLTKNKIYANSVTFTDVTSVPVQRKNPQTTQTTEDNEEQQEDTQASNQIDMLECMSLTITYKAPYDKIISFINDMQSNAVDIVISDINFTATADGEVQGSMLVSFYSIDKLKDSIYEEWVWKKLIESGVDNPFFKEGKIENSASNTIKKYDFIMTAKPTSADLPTLVFGKSNDKTRSSYVYEDSNNIENINISFKKDGDKYYYKYNTASSQFPVDGSYKLFSPLNKGSINIIIYSTKRNSAGDTSGVKINITNDTGLSINVKVDGDDSSRPRVSFDTLKGINLID